MLLIYGIALNSFNDKSSIFIIVKEFFLLYYHCRRQNLIVLQFNQNISVVKSCVYAFIAFYIAIHIFHTQLIRSFYVARLCINGVSLDTLSAVLWLLLR